MDYLEKLTQLGFDVQTKDIKLNIRKKYNLTCPKKHKIFTRLDNILSRTDRKSKGCIFCCEEDRNTSSYEISLKHLPENFEIIGSYRKDVQRKEARTIKKYKIKCSQNHEFEIENGRFKNLSCPQCNKQIYMGQERTREIFQQVFGVEFKSIRPIWLQNPKTKRNLELDGYNKELNLAFEFQGRQHTTANTQFADEYNAQTERDELKRQLCKKNGINLIEIHQPTKYEEKKFIQNVLLQVKQQINLLEYPNVNFKKDNINFDNLKFDGLRWNVKEFTDYLQSESPIKGYSCLETGFHTYEDKITMCCPKGHHFHTTAAEFKRNSEGKKGRETPCKVCFTESGQASIKVDLEYCREEGKKHGLELLSTEYKNVNEELEWKDSNGEIVRLNFRKLQRRKLVKKSNTKGIDLDYCRAEGAKYKLELLSTEYKNVNEKLLWKKVTGEKIELNLRQIQRSKTGVF